MGMGHGQAKGTGLAVQLVAAEVELLDLDRLLHVPEQPDVVAPLTKPGAGQEGVRGGLEDTLGRHNPPARLKAIGDGLLNLELEQVVSQGHSLLDLEDQVAAVDPGQQNQVATSPKTPDANAVTNDVGDVEVSQVDPDILTDVLPIRLVTSSDGLVVRIAEVLSTGRVVPEDQLAAVVDGPHLADDFLGITVLALLDDV